MFLENILQYMSVSRGRDHFFFDSSVTAITRQLKWQLFPFDLKTKQQTSQKCTKSSRIVLLLLILCIVNNVSKNVSIIFSHPLI